MLKHICKKKHPKAHPITDHAIVRFLERSEILDIRAMRCQLMTRELKKALQISKTTDHAWEHNENGLHYIVRNGAVITIMTYDDLRKPNGDILDVNPGTHPLFES